MKRKRVPVFFFVIFVFFVAMGLCSTLAYVGGTNGIDIVDVTD